MPYLEQTNLDLLLCEPATETSREEWLHEGLQLKLLGKYEQAIDAFIKAGANEEIQQCENLLARTKNYGHLQEYEAILKFGWQIARCKSINQMLNSVRRRIWEKNGGKYLLLCNKNGRTNFVSSALFMTKF